MSAKVEAPRERGLKNRVPLSTTVSIEAREQLNEIHELTRIPMARLIDESIQYLYNVHVLKQSPSNDR